MKKHILISGVHDEEKKACYDCHFNECALLNCFCSSLPCINERKTRKANNENCKYWEPCLTLEELEANKKWYDKFFGDDRINNYIQIEGKKSEK